MPSLQRDTDQSTSDKMSHQPRWSGGYRDPGEEPLVLPGDGEGKNEVWAEWAGWGRVAVSQREVEPRPESKEDPVVTLRLVCFPWCLLDQSWSGLLTSLWVRALETGPPGLRTGQAASYLCEFCPRLPRKRRRALAHSSSRIPGPQPLHHTLSPGQVCALLAARGEPGGWGERFYSSMCAVCVCLPPEGWVLLIHRWVTPWNTGSLPVRTESGRRVDKTTWSRKRKAQRSAEWELPAARRRAATPAAADRAPARPCLRSGWAATSASRSSCPQPGPPPGGKVSRLPGGKFAALGCELAFLCRPWWLSAPRRIPTVSRTSLELSLPPLSGASPEMGFR